MHYSEVLNYFAAPAACNVDATNYTGNNIVPAMNRPNKRSREADDSGRQPKLQISFNDLFQDGTDRLRSIPNLNVVSTGLRLSYDDDEHNSSVTSASGSMPPLPNLLSLGDNLRAVIDRHQEEVDQYIRIQEEQMSKDFKDLMQRQIASLVHSVENGVARKLREKDLQIESMNRRTLELVEQIKQQSMEVQSWQNKARYAESVANVLKGNLKQAIAQGADQGREGCGDSEVENAASSCHPNRLFGGFLEAGTSSGKGAVTEQVACKSCKRKEVCILLTPCKHLCLCEDCVGFVDFCPICRSVKTGSIQVELC